MISSTAREQEFFQKVSERLYKLCRPPTTIDARTGLTSVIPDQDFQNIAACLRDIDEEQCADRPRIYTILYMMQRIDLMSCFVTTGLLDNSFPYPNRRSLPKQMQRDPDACELFLGLQKHVMSTGIEMEKGPNSPHVYADSGDVFFESLGKLGKGGDATVDKVRSRVTRHEYARKRIHRQKDLNRDKQVVKNFENELQILKRLDHVHLINVFASYTDLKYVAIIMKPVATMDLRQYLRNCTSAPVGLERIQFRTYYGCLASAIAYLHENNIRHKDIKPSNILLKKNDIYITDFGTAIEFDDDKSTTRGTVKPRTVKYQSPEVARGTKRGTASDIWSLGVTFLEMTTILRGETLDAMQRFLTKNGTCDEFVFENIPGALQWTEYLVKNADYPRQDNAPMQWIKDMLEQKAIKRPTAKLLLQEIRQTADGIFCGKICRCTRSSESESDISDTDSDSGDEEDITIKTSVQENASHPTPKPVSVQSENPSNDREEVSVLTGLVKTTFYPLPLLLYKQVSSRVFSYLQNISGFRTEAMEVPPLPQTTLTPIQATNIDSHELWSNPDPYEYYIPGSFPGQRPSAYTRQLHPTNADEGTPANVKTVEPVICETPLPTPEQLPLQETLMPVTITIPSQVESTQKDSDVPNPASGVLEDNNKYPTVLECTSGLISAPGTKEVEEIGLVEKCIFNPRRRGVVTHISGPSRESLHALQSILLSPSRQLHRSQSDKNLQIKRQTNSLLRNAELNCEDGTQASPRARRLSDGTPSEDLQDLPMKSMLENLKDSKKVLDSSLVFLDAPLNASDSPSPRPEDLSHKLPIPQTVEDLTRLFVHKANDIYGKEPLLNPNEPSENDPKLPQTPIHASSRQLPSKSKGNPILSWLTNARTPGGSQQNPGPPRLTDQNLDFHNVEVPPLRKARPTFKIESASVYMQKVYDDAASSVPTSIMSTRTRESFKFSGLMLPWQDRTGNFLERYTKSGKADAVRMLLREGCNPGTKKNPRPGPIFDVIRGASSRHTKCLRALIEHDVDVNVKARWTGKTPLSEAIEQEPWSGYATVIFLLLKAGANPNTKDGSGDVPLLKLLGSGLQPLEEPRRKALALLLSTTYNTNVGVTPLGTRNKPLHLAIRRMDPYAVGMLLEKDDSLIEAENSEGLTPLSLAAGSWNLTMTSDQYEILDLLLEKEANVNIKIPFTNKTPLHIAVSHGLVDAVERLVEHGADTRIKTTDGKTVFDMLKEREKAHACLECADCTAIRRFMNKGDS